MNFKTIRLPWLLLVVILGILFLGGCNTWKGAGKDVERAGEKMQEDK